MCLISKDNNVQIAEKPITAYKVLNFEYKSPCKRFDYNPYVRDTNKIVCDVTPYPFFDYTCGKYIVEEGLHLFTDIYHAEEFADDATELIFKCEIPVGSYFIKGGYGEICTNRFRFIERI